MFIPKNKLYTIIIGVYLIIISCKTSRQDSSPNVLIILADDLGWSQLSCYGSDFYDTPNIDKLAQTGIKFTNAYSSASICSPTRAAIMTGKYPARIGLTDFIPGNSPKNKPLLTPDNWQRFLPLDEITIAEKIKSSGYATGFFGKWHLSQEKQPPKSLLHNPNMQGFSESFVTYKPSKNLIQQWQAENKDFHNVDTITKRALDFLNQYQKSPFFLFLSHNTIHDPLIENEKSINKYRNKDGSEKNQNNPIIGAMIKTLDKSVGQIVKKLESLKSLDNTIIIFYSDNGGKHAHASQKPFRKGKGWLYEGGIRVPTIATWPNKIKAGTKSNHPSIFYDYFATVCDVLGVKPPYPIDGISYYASLTGKPQQQHDYLYWEFPAYGGQQAIRMGSWKGFKKNLFKGMSDLQLYDLSKDPKELNDLSAKYPEIVQKMENFLDQAHTTASQENFRIPILEE